MIWWDGAVNNVIIFTLTVMVIIIVIIVIKVITVIKVIVVVIITFKYWLSSHHLPGAWINDLLGWRLRIVSHPGNKNNTNTNTNANTKTITPKKHIYTITKNKYNYKWKSSGMKALNKVPSQKYTQNNYKYNKNSFTKTSTYRITNTNTTTNANLVGWRLWIMSHPGNTTLAFRQ